MVRALMHCICFVAALSRYFQYSCAIARVMGSLYDRNNKPSGKNNNGSRGRHWGAHCYPKNFGDLGDSCWGILPFHKLDIPRIAKLARKFCYSATGNTDKIDILELGLADMTRVC